MESIGQLKKKLKLAPGEWEEKIYHWVCSLGSEIARACMEDMDNELMRKRGRGLEVEGIREHLVVTAFGDVRIKRRLYRDSKGECRFLLDEAMGLDKRSHVSPKVKEMAAFISSHVPFQMTEQLMRSILPAGISHTTIHRLVGKITEPYIEAEEKEITALYRDGVMPESEGKVVPHLFVEADGTYVALQREKARRIEIKTGIAYEGWEKMGKDRFRLTGKTVYSGVMDGDRFWEGFSLDLSRKYDLAKVGKVIVGGDGANWVKNGTELLGGIYQLDRFHLSRALHQVLDIGLAIEVYQACIKGEALEADRLLAEAQEAAAGKADGKADEIRRLRGYLLHNAAGLRDYRLEINNPDLNLRGMGAMESNVDKLSANRMKKRGMSWRISGARRMTKLICLREMGKLHSWIASSNNESQTLTKTENDIAHRKINDTGTWLRVRIPAFQESPDRVWVDILRQITNGSNSGLSPTNS